MGGVGGGKEFDSKVIDSKGEGGRQGGVGPKTRGVCHRSVAMGLEVVEKAFVGDDTGFLESVHPLSDFDLDIATWSTMCRSEYSTTTLCGISLRWIRMNWKLAIGLLR